jgi:hypothetical protein
VTRHIGPRRRPLHERLKRAEAWRLLLLRVRCVRRARVASLAQPKLLADAGDAPRELADNAAGALAAAAASVADSG